MSCGHSPPASSSPLLLAWGHSPLTCSQLGPMVHPASRRPSDAVTVGASVPHVAHSHLVCQADKDREPVVVPITLWCLITVGTC